MKDGIKYNLVEEILNWWESVKNDTYSNGEDEYNVYDEPPRFVKAALEISKNEKNGK